MTSSDPADPPIRQPPPRPPSRNEAPSRNDLPFTGESPFMSEPPPVPPAPAMAPPVATPEPPPLPPPGGPTEPPGPPHTPTYAPPPSVSSKGSMYDRMGGQNNLLGWLALIFGIIGTGCCCCWFLDGAPFAGGIPAIILGFLHLQRIKQRRASMGWLGWAGIILGAIALLGAICNFATHWNDDLHNRFADSY